MANCNFQPVLLKNGKTVDQKRQEKKWEIIINTDIEIDE